MHPIFLWGHIIHLLYSVNKHFTLSSSQSPKHKRLKSNESIHVYSVSICPIIAFYELMLQGESQLGEVSTLFPQLKSFPT